MAYKDILRNAIRTFEDLEKWLTAQKARVDPRLKDVIAKYPMRVNTYYLSLIEKVNDGIWKQAIPDVEELVHYMDLTEDPLDEEGDIPLGGPRTIIHRYPDRVLLFVSNECAMYCRFCTRKRKVGDDRKNPSMEDITKGIEYVASHEDIRDVLISGGDPLLIPTKRLDEVLGKLRQIPHLDLIRIGTRVPCVWPQRIIEDTELIEMLRKHTPRSLDDPQLFINTHFNHPNEITPQSYQAVKILRDLGIPVANQSVLLKGVNDDTDVMRDLVHGLGRMGVRPYYLYYADLVEGTGHFRTEVYKGKEICRDLCGATTGFLRPTYVVDAMGGRGKVPVDLGYSDGISEDRKGGILTSAIGLGRVYVNDPIDRIEGKPTRHNPNRK
ncbi:MAG: KamA family radical SAM protein [Sedimentisphaerales bacterium]|jgi:lysine 2,3-aminomutase|nr:KamA family radical SAM protein [Sedimentisphaerales bacterium]HNY77405.1 KamA family radical SAM protein [Sedimentisphaerales bacterium]HOC62809.1 KamA family radical SAM protein [Sedimentisphaerales bacterium]HOH63705.1 KamA family radical SAM protein [Sedimentisphaerales bacterium]HQA89012.1 KamA family radical SAM protein [Sedimentisphaerales bacterium]